MRAPPTAGSVRSLVYMRGHPVRTELYRGSRLSNQTAHGVPCSDPRRLLYVVNVPLDLRVLPDGQATGAKHPSLIMGTLGGAGGNAAVITSLNGIPSDLIGAQAAGPVAEWCRTLAEERGVRLRLIER